MLKSKDQQVRCFKALAAWSKTQTGNPIKNIRTDGEWCSEEFKELKTKYGFNHRQSTRNTPQSNGVAERHNGVIGQKARVMLIDSNLPPSLAGEALNTAVYLHNRTPSLKLSEKTHQETTGPPSKMVSPYQIFFNKSPRVDHLRAFGCKAWRRTDNRVPSAVEPKGKAGSMVAYDIERACYKIHFSDTKTVKTSKDVEFDENVRGYILKEPKPDHFPPLFEQDSEDMFSEHHSSREGEGVSDDSEVAIEPIDTKSIPPPFPTHEGGIGPQTSAEEPSRARFRPRSPMPFRTPLPPLEQGTAPKQKVKQPFHSQTSFDALGNETESDLDEDSKITVHQTIPTAPALRRSGRAPQPSRKNSTT